MPVRDLGRLKLSDLLFWVLAGVSAVLLVVLALILSGVIPIDPASQSEGRSREYGRTAADGVVGRLEERRRHRRPRADGLAPGTVSVVLPDGATSAANAAAESA